MTVRLVADIQNRLFCSVGTGRASECRVPSGDGARHPEMGSNVSAEQRLQGMQRARPGPAAAAPVWIEVGAIQPGGGRWFAPR